MTSALVQSRVDAEAVARVSDGQPTFAADVARDLSQRPKRLQPKYLYDALGSHLFEAICELPWYRITRAERGLLESEAPAIIHSLGELSTLIELGCGSGEKIALLAAALRRGRPARVHLVDISATALELSERTLASLPHVSVVTHRAFYQAGLRDALAARSARGATLVVFLGSNIGNFDVAEAHAFLRGVRRALAPGDALLLGADLVKSEPDLLLAYDDPLGVTAAFNRNLLVRINRELGGTFDVVDFAHCARWNAAESRVEMHLAARRAHQVRIAAADLTVAFTAGETIWTESSYKYSPASIRALAETAGFRCREQWLDGHAGFALSLFVVA